MRRDRLGWDSFKVHLARDLSVGSDRSSRRVKSSVRPLLYDRTSAGRRSEGGIHQVPNRSEEHRARWLLPALALLGAVVTLALNFGLVRETLSGTFFDPDDAMRLAEVRAWLAGQSWYDMRALRLDPPGGSFMHWSRLVDMPMAALIAGFSQLTDHVFAERWAAVAAPALWSVLLFLGVLRLATRLVGLRAPLPVVLGLLASGTILILFAPGRIGHHAPETVVLVFAVALAVDALEPGRHRRAAWSGVLVALSLAMSLETLPFDVVLGASMISLWVGRGASRAPPLGWFAAGLLLALPAFFVADVAPSRWLLPVCDAYGAAHLGAGLIAGCGLLACAALGSSLGIAARAAAATLVGASAATFVALAYPACLGSPFAAVDPLVRELWLSRVVESLPLPAFAQIYPMMALAIAGTVALGACGCIVAAARERAQRDGFLIVGLVAVAGLVLSFWQVRVLTSAAPLAFCGGVYVATRFRPLLAAGVILLFGATTWALILPDDDRPAADLAAAKAKSACLSPAGLAPLAALQPGSAVAPLDAGSHLIEATRLSVFAAPYHRNDDGNRFALEVFLAAPDRAEALLAARHVAYVVVCPGIVDLDRLAKRAPDGLAARLSHEQVPVYLKAVPLVGTPYRVYAMTAH